MFRLIFAYKFTLGLCVRYSTIPLILSPSRHYLIGHLCQRLSARLARYNSVSSRIKSTEKFRRLVRTQGLV